MGECSTANADSRRQAPKVIDKRIHSKVLRLLPLGEPKVLPRFPEPQAGGIERGVEVIHDSTSGSTVTIISKRDDGVAILGLYRIQLPKERDYRRGTASIGGLPW